MTSLTSLTDPTGYFAAIRAIAVAHHIPATIVALILSAPLALLLFGAEQVTQECDFCGRRMTRLRAHKGGGGLGQAKAAAENVCEVCCLDLDATGQGQEKPEGCGKP